MNFCVNFFVEFFSFSFHVFFAFDGISKILNFRWGGQNISGGGVGGGGQKIKLYKMHVYIDNMYI